MLSRLIQSYNFEDANRTSQDSAAVIFMELEKILAEKSVSVVFQPVVSLIDGEVIGYEALSRGPADSPLERPDALFSAAARFDLLWELEYLCRSKALEKASGIFPEKMLFLNVDPAIINDPRFTKGQTHELIKKFHADAGCIIFEITEKTAINDYKGFCRVLENYTSQGYKIAIDDTGAGYSGLRTLVETRPHYIKIDMALVRDIDKDGFKQALMKLMYDFAALTGSKLIAEGIETEDELSALINIGVHYGQGYFLQKPSPAFLEVPPGIKKLICEKNRRKRLESTQTTMSTPIGDLARLDQPFPPTTKGGRILEYFHDNPKLQGVPIVDNGKPVGLVMKNKFFASLATQFGVAVYMNRPISMLMDPHPLVVEWDTPLDEVAKLAMCRAEDNIYDYVIITQKGHYLGTITIKRLLEKISQLELNRAKYANPLTGLPGNVIIENELTRLIADGEPFAVLYIDLDNFKAYNDVYGFDNGDKVICYTAEVLRQVLTGLPSQYSFLGHIGGDDFLIALRTTEVDAICRRIITAFDRHIGDFYTEADKKQGYIVAKNRHGIEERFPMISLSIACVTSAKHRFNQPAEIAELAGMIKKHCKLTWQSCYVIE